MDLRGQSCSCCFSSLPRGVSPAWGPQRLGLTLPASPCLPSPKPALNVLEKTGGPGAPSAAGLGTRTEQSCPGRGAALGPPGCLDSLVPQRYRGVTWLPLGTGTCVTPEDTGSARETVRLSQTLPPSPTQASGVASRLSPGRREHGGHPPALVSLAGLFPASSQRPRCFCPGCRALSCPGQVSLDHRDTPHQGTPGPHPML